MKINLAHRMIAASATIALPGTPGLAAPTAQPAQAPDPNKVICEKQEVLGSRLSTRRVCMTRSQWEDLRLQDRQAIERVQSGPARDH